MGDFASLIHQLTGVNEMALGNVWTGGYNGINNTQQNLGNIDNNAGTQQYMYEQVRHMQNQMAMQDKMHLGQQYIYPGKMWYADDSGTYYHDYNRDCRVYQDGRIVTSQFLRDNGFSYQEPKIKKQNTKTLTNLQWLDSRVNEIRVRL